MIDGKNLTNITKLTLTLHFTAYFWFGKSISAVTLQEKNEIANNMQKTKKKVSKGFSKVKTALSAVCYASIAKQMKPKLTKHFSR